MGQFGESFPKPEQNNEQELENLSSSIKRICDEYAEEIKDQSEEDKSAIINAMKVAINHTLIMRLAEKYNFDSGFSEDERKVGSFAMTRKESEAYLGTEENIGGIFNLDDELKESLNEATVKITEDCEDFMESIKNKPNKDETWKKLMDSLGEIADKL